MVSNQITFVIDKVSTGITQTDEEDEKNFIYIPSIIMCSYFPNRSSIIIDTDSSSSDKNSRMLDAKPGAMIRVLLPKWFIYYTKDSILHCCIEPKFSIQVKAGKLIWGIDSHYLSEIITKYNLVPNFIANSQNLKTAGGTNSTISGTQANFNTLHGCNKGIIVKKTKSSKKDIDYYSVYKDDNKEILHIAGFSYSRGEFWL